MCFSAFLKCIIHLANPQDYFSFIDISTSEQEIMQYDYENSHSLYCTKQY